MTTLLLTLLALALAEVVSHHVQTGSVYLALHAQNRC